MGAFRRCAPLVRLAGATSTEQSVRLSENRSLRVYVRQGPDGYVIIEVRGAFICTGDLVAERNESD